jgi:hypothetical protein
VGLIQRSFQTVCRSSPGSAGKDFRFYGGAVATVSVEMTLTFIGTADSQCL